ncbi:hypothetical protein CDCA_CDCA05G1712 [Cyanidium caldarium]|uniref:Ribosomal silencing factor RsfS n=1 Tax=Cyanidium caldarium TaxID=2771 RepID=A0AAV9ITV0_CYACA|nr:hypothetical protein CDCA_CDCA05G1712 [Cyanidium caldarium]
MHLSADAPGARAPRRKSAYPEGQVRGVSPLLEEAPRVDMEQDESLPLVLSCLRAADERKAVDLVALRVRYVSYMTSFIVVVTGLSHTQVGAIARNIEEQVREQLQREPLSSTMHGENAGPKNYGGWVLLDYGDVLVNVMQPEARRYYGLETFWKAGEPLDVDAALGAPTLRSSPEQRTALEQIPSFGDPVPPYDPDYPSPQRPYPWEVERDPELDEQIKAEVDEELERMRKEEGELMEGDPSDEITPAMKRRVKSLKDWIHSPLPPRDQRPEVLLASEEDEWFQDLAKFLKKGIVEDDEAQKEEEEGADDGPPES